MNQNEQLQDTTPTPPVTTEKQANENPFWEILRFGLIAVIIVLPIRWYVAQPFIVSGASMEQTFHNNEYLIVDQVTYRFRDPKRAEVVIFRYPHDPSKYFIKRVIGLPGETVSIENNSVTITDPDNPDSFVLHEPYIAGEETTGNQSITLGEDEYFVMGDNRTHSSDSRTWGALDKGEIVGRAWLRLFPPTQLSFLPGSYTTK
ncbi:MAG: signal peptidase I [Candidatus Paceibacterota bacterium]